MNCENCNTWTATETVTVKMGNENAEFKKRIGVNPFLELWDVCQNCVDRVADDARRHGYNVEVATR